MCECNNGQVNTRRSGYAPEVEKALIDLAADLNSLFYYWDEGHLMVMPSALYPGADALLNPKKVRVLLGKIEKNKEVLQKFVKDFV